MTSTEREQALSAYQGLHTRILAERDVLMLRFYETGMLTVEDDQQMDRLTKGLINIERNIYRLQSLSCREPVEDSTSDIESRQTDRYTRKVRLIRPEPCEPIIPPDVLKQQNEQHDRALNALPIVEVKEAPSSLDHQFVDVLQRRADGLVGWHYASLQVRKHSRRYEGFSRG